MDAAVLGIEVGHMRGGAEFLTKSGYELCEWRYVGLPELIAPGFARHGVTKQLRAIIRRCQHQTAS